MTQDPRSDWRVSVEPSPRPGVSRVVVLYGGLKRRWFEFRQRGGEARLLQPPASGSLPIQSIGRIVKEAEESIRVFERAVSIAVERAGELFVRRFEREDLLDRFVDGSVDITTVYTSGRYVSEVKVIGQLYNYLAVGRSIVHGRGVSLTLIGIRLTGDELELLRQLGGDLAEIFRAPDLRDFKVEGALGERLSATQYIWADHTKYRLTGRG